MQLNTHWLTLDKLFFMSAHYNQHIIIQKRNWRCTLLMFNPNITFVPHRIKHVIFCMGQQWYWEKNIQGLLIMLQTSRCIPHSKTPQFCKSCKMGSSLVDRDLNSTCALAVWNGLFIQCSSKNDDQNIF